MSVQPLRVLHLEDNSVDAELVRYHLEAQAQAAGEPPPHITVTDTRASFEAALAQPAWDLILADYRLPAYDGLTALRAARAQTPETPFVFVTGELGEERAIETLREGATDYVLKTRLGRLGPSVARARRGAQDRAERRAAELALGRSEERYRSLVEAHSAIVWSADPRGYFVTEQASWAAYTGQPWPLHQGLGWLEMLHPDDRAAVRAAWAEAVGSRRPLQSLGRLWHAPGREWCHSELRAIPLLNPDGQLREWVGTITDVHARKTAESAARESEGRFRILVDHAPMLVWMANANGECDFFSQPWLNFTGRTLEQEKGQGWLDNVHPDDLERVMRLDRAATAQRRPLEIEYRLRRHDGEYRWVVDIGVPRHAPDGSFAGYIGSALDIHERKAAEAAQRESEGRFRILADTAPVMVWMADPFGLADFFNQTWLAFTGRPLEAELGDGWTTGLHPLDFERTLSAYRAGFAARQPFELEFQLRRQDGEYRWVVSTAVPRYATDGSFAGYIGSGLDIHERKAAAQALRATRDQIAAILRGVAEGVTVHDAAGVLVYANDMAAQLLGYATAEALVAAPPGDVLRRFHVFDEQGQPFPLQDLPGRRALQGEPEPSALVRFRTADGEAEYWSEIRARPIFDADGRAVLAVNIFHDITAIKRAAQAQRLLADAGALLGSALDAAHLTSELLALLVPELADLGVLYLFEPGGAIHAAAYAQADPADAPLLVQAAQAYQPDPHNAHSLLTQVLQSGQAQLVTGLSEALLNSLPAPTGSALRALVIQSALLAPLVAHGQTLGVILLGRQHAPRYTPADLALADEVAHRTALALENARLYAEAQQQTALLEARVHERTETLRQSERRLAEAQQIASLGSWHWDIARNVVTWSDELYHIYGVDPATFTATYEGFQALIHPDDLEFVRRTVRSALEQRQSYEYEHRIVRPDGQERVLAARAEITLNAAGEPIALTGISRDVTNQLRIESELRASQAQLRQLSGHLQAARETERARISREIHDELGGALTGLKMDVSRLSKNLPTLTPEGAQAEVQGLLALLDDAVKTVRRIATDLRPALLDDFGLAAAMEWQLQEFEKRSGLRCTFTTNAQEATLPPETVTALFRVFQETLTNVARHAQATVVTARLELAPAHLELEVHDNGRGISTGALNGRRSLGLLGMRERVNLLAGELRIEGAPGQGTRVTVRIPVEAHA